MFAISPTPVARRCRSLLTGRNGTGMPVEINKVANRKYVHINPSDAIPPAEWICTLLRCAMPETSDLSGYILKNETSSQFP